MTKKALVTGANGYVASWLVKKLLEEDYTVHAAVRDPKNKSKVAHLEKLVEAGKDKLVFFAADLLEEGSYEEAMQGCEIVFHTASPFTTVVDNPEKDLIEPAVKGTENVLKSANKTPSVKRVVLTSSCAAIYTDAIDCKNTPSGMLTEEIWNTTASVDYQPYSYSKLLAEKKAWEIANQQEQWSLVTINPSLVMGPPLNPGGTTSESFNILKQIGDGTFKSGAPKLGIGLVDVRDVAEAHYRAGISENANGRYITSAHNTNMFEMAQTLIPKYGNNYPIPKSVAPKWLLMVFGPLVNKALSRKFIRNNVNVEWKADNSKIKNDLGIEFRDMNTTMEDSFQSLVEAGIFNKKS